MDGFFAVVALGALDDFELGHDVVADHEEAESEAAPAGLFASPAEVAVAVFGETAAEDSGAFLGFNLSSGIYFNCCVFV